MARSSPAFASGKVYSTDCLEQYPLCQRISLPRGQKMSHLSVNDPIALRSRMVARIWRSGSSWLWIRFSAPNTESDVSILEADVKLHLPLCYRLIATNLHEKKKKGIRTDIYWMRRQSQSYRSFSFSRWTILPAAAMLLSTAREPH